MTMNDGERELRDFVLQKLADEDRERLEEALFSDDELFESLVEAEYEVIDEWARGTLSPQQKREVELVIGGSARGAEKLRFARTLVNRAEHARVVPIDGFRRRSATWVPIAAAAGVAAVVAGLWFAAPRTAPDAPEARIAEGRPAVERRAPVASAPVVVAESETVTPEVSTPSSPAPAQEPRIAIPREPLTLALSLATLRSEAVEPVLAIDEPRPVSLTVALDPADRFDTYSIVVTGPAGEVVHTESSVRPIESEGTLLVEATIPAAKLSEGFHEVAVQADGMDLGFVSFRVRR